MEGGEDTTDWKMFYESRRVLRLSGTLVGLAVSLAIISNPQYFQQASNYSLYLLILFAVVAFVTNALGRHFSFGLSLAGVFVAFLLLSQGTRPLLQSFLTVPYLGGIEIALLILAGLLITRA